MKTLTLLLALLLASAAGPAQAQTTNGITTSTERQAAYDAATRSEAQQRNRAAGSSSSAGSTSSSSSGGQPLTNKENEARINALFGFKTAEQKAAEARQIRQRYETGRAAEQAATDMRRADDAAVWQRMSEFDRVAEGQAKPWLALGFTPGDARTMGYKTRGDREGGKPWGSPADLALLDRVKASRQAFLALYDQPTASYEALRQLTQQLPLQEDRGADQFGLGTALEQYGLLLQRFPAHRTAAAADVLAAGAAYLGSSRALENKFDSREFHQHVVQLLREAAANSPALGQAMAARLGPVAVQMGKYYHTSGQYDTLASAPLLRFSYRAAQQYLQLLRPGQPAPAGLTEAQLRATAGDVALMMSETMLGLQQPLLTRQWLLRAAAANPGAREAVAGYFAVLLANYPAVWPAMQPADWQRLAPAIGLAEPLRVAEVLAWLADTVLVPDLSRWQALTPAQQASLGQAQKLGNWLQTGSAGKNSPPALRLATWNYLLSPAGSPAAGQAEAAWHAAAEQGQVVGARNLYRHLLLRKQLTKENGLLEPLYRLAQSQQNASKGQGKYLAALLLDELPGYPPLGRSDKKEGKRWMKEAAAAGSPAAVAWLAL